MTEIPDWAADMVEANEALGDKLDRVMAGVEATYKAVTAKPATAHGNTLAAATGKRRAARLPRGDTPDARANAVAGHVTSARWLLAGSAVTRAASAKSKATMASTLAAAVASTATKRCSPWLT